MRDGVGGKAGDEKREQNDGRQSAHQEHEGRGAHGGARGWCQEGAGRSAPSLIASTTRVQRTTERYTGVGGASAHRVLGVLMQWRRGGSNPGKEETDSLSRICHLEVRAGDKGLQPPALTPAAAEARGPRRRNVCVSDTPRLKCHAGTGVRGRY